MNANARNACNKELRNRINADCPDAPLAEAVPPKFYGGTERVVFWLTEELVKLGHEVTLFASGESVTSAKLEPCSAKALRLDRHSPDPMLVYAAMLARVAEKADEFDVLHVHIDWVHSPLLRRLGVPFLTTLHGRLDHPALGTLCRDWFAGAQTFTGQAPSTTACQKIC